MTEADIQKLVLDNSLSQEEQLYLKQILLELSETGSSQTLTDIYAADYEEIPVSIEEFVTNRRYLGNSCLDDDDNLTIYPFWRKAFKDIFNPKNEIMEVALSGCIGSGKTTSAVICLCYILYKLLCLKNPASYYKLNKGSKIAIAFFNINMDQAYGVGYAKMQSYLKASPWFLDHGTVYGRVYQTYYPDKDIELLVGSKMEHFIGRDVFCLDGDTVIHTKSGFSRIKDLVDNPQKVYNSQGVLSDEPVESMITTYTDEIIELELEDGSIIKCTPNHKFMLKDGSFKEAQFLTEDDELFELNK